MHRIFLLSPANSGGERARMLFNPRAGFALARRLQGGQRVALGEIFSFLSGLYFRGKYAYARTFGSPPRGLKNGYVITPTRGLVPVEQRVILDDLREFGTVPIDPSEPKYFEPLNDSASRLGKRIGPGCDVVLLGSISTNKYVEPLLAHFGERLLFPSSFVGRGDMSRGGLLLRCVAGAGELDYIPVAGAVRRGKRPEKLAARSWGYRILDGKTAIGRTAIGKGAN